MTMLNQILICHTDEVVLRPTFHRVGGCSDSGTISYRSRIILFVLCETSLSPIIFRLACHFCGVSSQRWKHQLDPGHFYIPFIFWIEGILCPL